MIIALALLWHFVFSSPGRRVDLFLLVLAALLGGWAWIQYLCLDGILQHGLISRLGQDSPLKKKRSPSMMDYVDEEPDVYQPEDEKRERRLASLCANLLGALLCLLGSLLFGYVLL
ncbi:MAG: hypothetical protein IJR95_00825 [Lachnospiraceae bacterium]|nr:hypothetical protein [Lachnospiraceae bacterium]